VLEALRIVHHYGTVNALDDVSLSVEEGEFLTILGPSGSGKTTLLRIIGGFEMPTSATALRIGGNDVLGLPPNHREVATVFQHYALFPHMTVGGNVEFGLKVRGMLPLGRRRRAEDVLRLVRLTDKYDRRIQQLSGGERQRVAFARALVTEPRLLLLDEPMGALDEKLRREMQVEVRALQRELRMTFILVTHSQEEALTMSDRIAIMNRGRIEQLGSPSDIFGRPETQFVAEFMGMTNVFVGRIRQIAGPRIMIERGGVELWGQWTGADAPAAGQSAFLAVHPLKVNVRHPNEESATASNSVEGILRLQAFKGGHTDLVMDTVIGSVTASVVQSGIEPGARAALEWRAEDSAIGPAAEPPGGVA
jgi:ABC-type Fe3+/spermidine/putrescine transport system ATPase subunit